MARNGTAYSGKGRGFVWQSLANRLGLLALVGWALLPQLANAQNGDTGPGTVISYELKEVFNIDTLRAKMKARGLPKFLTPLRYDYRAYELLYRTQNPFGDTIQASAYLYVPVNGPPSMALVSYHHGTQVEAHRPLHLGGEQAIAMAYAADGYVVVFPHYMGLGKGEGPHYYQHKASSAQVVMDAIRAVRQLAPRLQVQLNDQLFLTGYSQGGYVTLATQQVMEAEHADEFRVTAASGMSGAYDMTGAQEYAMFEPYSHPGYLPYLLFSYNSIYELYPANSHFLKAPYDTLLPPLFDQEHNMGHINDAMPAVPADIILDSVRQAYQENPEHPFRKALADNNVYDWRPQAPLQLCYCQADEQVRYQNSLVAYRHMKARKAPRVIKRPSGRKLDHGTCALFAALYTKYWFDSFRNGSTRGRRGPLHKRAALGIFRGLMPKD